MFKKVFIKHLFEESKMKMPSLPWRERFSCSNGNDINHQCFWRSHIGKRDKRNRVNSI